MKRTYLKEHAFGQTTSYFIIVKCAYKPFDENLSFLHTQILEQIKKINMRIAKSILCNTKSLRNAINEISVLKIRLRIMLLIKSH